MYLHAEFLCRINVNLVLKSFLQSHIHLPAAYLLNFVDAIAPTIRSIRFKKLVKHNFSPVKMTASCSHLFVYAV